MSLRVIEQCLQEHEQTFRIVEAQLQPKILEAALAVREAVLNGQTIFICGNGGSAADAQHIAAEFTGRFIRERKGLSAIALTTDTSALTAIANDYGYTKVFARQLEALAKPGDVLIAISTSGNSANVLEALFVAAQNQMTSIGLSGKDGGEMNRLCTYNIVVPSTITARIQEMHILIGHIFCQIADEKQGYAGA